jgi:ABC-type multidrug transport system fused ATPase/permease subunit
MDIGEKLILVAPEIMSLSLVVFVLSLQSHFEKALVIAFLYSLLRVFTSLNQINFYMNTAMKLGDLPNEIHSYLDKWSGPAQDTSQGRAPIGRIQSVSFENVRVMKGGREICAVERFECRSGDRIQMSGPNGSGKSSLVKALLGLMPYEGKIRVNGTDLVELDRGELFQRIAYLPQRFYLFNQSILENLRVGNDAPREKIEALLAKLGIDVFVNSLENGLDTIISEDMKNLSGGQIQALSIARTFLKDADVYILDEYGNNLDANIRKKVDVYLREELSDAVLILITHLPIPFTTKMLAFAAASEDAHEVLT